MPAVTGNTNNSQGGLFARVSAVFNHKPSLWTSTLASGAAKENHQSAEVGQGGMVLWLPACLAAVVTVCAAILFPRAPTWQIADMKYNGVSFNSDMSVNMKIQMGLEVFNPNYVPATLNGIVMTLFHEDIAGHEAPFGAVSFRGEDPARLPARGSAVVQAQLEVVSLPAMMGLGIAKEVADGGVMISRSLAVMDVTALGDILIEADCVQHMQADVFPIKITKIDCKYYYKDVRVLVLPP